MADVKTDPWPALLAEVERVRLTIEKATGTTTELLIKPVGKPHIPVGSFQERGPYTVKMTDATFSELAGVYPKFADLSQKLYALNGQGVASGHHKWYYVNLDLSAGCVKRTGNIIGTISF